MSKFDNLDTKLKITFKNETKMIKLRDKLFYLKEDDLFRLHVMKWISTLSLDSLQAILLVHHNFFVEDLGFINIKLLSTLHDQENGLTISTINSITRENKKIQENNFQITELENLKNLKPHLELYFSRFEPKDLLNKIKKAKEQLTEAEEFIIHELSQKEQEENVHNKLTSNNIPRSVFEIQEESSGGGGGISRKPSFLEFSKDHHYLPNHENKWKTFVENNLEYFELEQDLKFIENMKQDPNENLMKQNLKKIVSFRHSVGILISKFLVDMIEFHNLKLIFLLKCYLFLDHDDRHLNEISVIINEFVESLCQILFKRFWKVDSENFFSLTKKEMKNFILSKGYYYKIYLSYQKLNSKEDSKFHEKCQKFKYYKKLTLSDLNISKKYLNVNFSNVIDNLKEIDFPTSFDEKIDFISSLISQISLNVSTFYGEEILLGSDEMIPILIYCIIEASPLNIYSTLNFLKDRIDNTNGVEGENYF
jgi:hypothetical protein